jgi:hypothetical protein
MFTGQYAFTHLPVAVLDGYGGEIFGRAFAGNSAVSAPVLARIWSRPPLSRSL